MQNANTSLRLSNNCCVPLGLVLWLELMLWLVTELVIELVTEFGRINVIHTNPPSVPYYGSGSPTALHASIIFIYYLTQREYYRIISIIFLC